MFYVLYYFNVTNNTHKSSLSMQLVNLICVKLNVISCIKFVLDRCSFPLSFHREKQIPTFDSTDLFFLIQYGRLIS